MYNGGTPLFGMQEDGLDENNPHSLDSTSRLRYCGGAAAVARKSPKCGDEDER